jgi:site-specific DNA-cytosine methylase
MVGPSPRAVSTSTASSAATTNSSDDRYWTPGVAPIMVRAVTYPKPDDDSSNQDASSHEKQGMGVNLRSKFSQELAESDESYRHVYENMKPLDPKHRDDDNSGRRSEGNETSEDDEDLESLNNHQRIELSQVLTQEKVDYDAIIRDMDLSNLSGHSDRSIANDTNMADPVPVQGEIEASLLNQVMDEFEGVVVAAEEPDAKKRKVDHYLSPQRKIPAYFAKAQPVESTDQTSSAPDDKIVWESHRRHFMVGDTWKSSAKALQPYYFTISNRGRGKHRSKVVVRTVHIHLGDTFIGPEQSKDLIEHRRGLLGNKHPDKARYVTTLNLLEQGRIRLEVLTDRVTVTDGGPLESDLIYERGTKEKEKSGFTCAYRYKLETTTRQRWNVSHRRFNKPTVLDLFGGGGGMSLGLQRAGFHITHHVDNDRAACNTLERNFPQSISFPECAKLFLKNCKEGRTRLYPQPGDFDHIHGSPPCQGLSDANRNGGMNDDANNGLTAVLVECIKYFLPSTFSIENVMGLLKHSRGRRTILLQAITELLKVGYQVRLCIVLASDYGDPQNRERVLLLGAQKGHKLPDFPKATHGESPGLLRRVTVKDVLGDLENILPVSDSGLVELPDGRLVWNHCLNGSPSEDGSKPPCRLVANKTAPTVRRTNLIKHYGCGERALTILELQLLQGFPLEYLFSGDHKKIRDQIGNAVPVNLAENIGRGIMNSYTDP